MLRERNKGVEGNEKADEWAKVGAEEPDTRGVERLSDTDWTEVRPMPLSWRKAGGRTSKKNYKMLESHKPDGTVRLTRHRRRRPDCHHPHRHRGRRVYSPSP